MSGIEYNKVSGQRLMWMMVMFDLPVLTSDEVKEANKFRNFLKDMGFEMAQLSVYVRFVGAKEKTEKYIRAVKENLPHGGKVDILFFTDKQFENIISFDSREKQTGKKKPEAYIQF
ncbi:MAG: CRISPR-associated endonuclease Cas2 [Spirochaetia bacterium]|jgi:CRISPR-associated protein Cas2|nr:CRISPR-associated endonuclease Cas2 [Spirochaetia bacterium]